jgi:CheY-like chemotaxis protein
MSLPMTDALLISLFAGGIGLAMGAGLPGLLKALWRRHTAAAVAAARAARPSQWPAQTVRAAGQVSVAVTSPIAPLPVAADLLLVDDSAVARAKLRRLFEPAGYQVHLAKDGVEALALLERGRYAMLITDLEMPNMDGVTLINTCLARPLTAHMPILAISGHESLRAKFNECRAICGVHRKPWVDDILLSHVATLVGTRQPLIPALTG